LLALFDTRAPGYPRLCRNAPARFHLFRRLGNPFPQSPKRGWPEMRREMCRIRARRLNIRWRRLTRRTLSQESLCFYFFNVAFAARSRYRAIPYPRPITLFRVPAQPSNEIYATDPLLGWGGLAAGGLEVIDIEGFSRPADVPRTIRARACREAARSPARGAGRGQRQLDCRRQRAPEPLAQRRRSANQRLNFLY